MSKAKTRRSVLDRPKERYTVSEVAPEFAAVLGITESGARNRIYRAINEGRIKAVSYLGSLRLPHTEVSRILNGEPY